MPNNQPASGNHRRVIEQACRLLLDLMQDVGVVESSTSTADQRRRAMARIRALSKASSCLPKQSQLLAIGGGEFPEEERVAKEVSSLELPPKKKEKMEENKAELTEDEKAERRRREGIEKMTPEEKKAALYTRVLSSLNNLRQAEMKPNYPSRVVMAIARATHLLVPLLPVVDAKDSAEKRAAIWKWTKRTLDNYIYTFNPEFKKIKLSNPVPPPKKRKRGRKVNDARDGFLMQVDANLEDLGFLDPDHTLANRLAAAALDESPKAFRERRRRMLAREPARK